MTASELAKEAKSYLKDREERHLRSISKEVVMTSLKKFGKDILKDESFYQDLPEIATKKLSSVFINNTYLMDSKGSQTARIMENMKGEEVTSLNEAGEEKHAKILLNIKK